MPVETVTTSNGRATPQPRVTSANYLPTHSGTRRGFSQVHKRRRLQAIADTIPARYCEDISTFAEGFELQDSQMQLKMDNHTWHRQLILAYSSGKTVREADAALTLTELTKEPIYFNPKIASPSHSQRPEPNSGQSTELTTHLQWQAVDAIETSMRSRFPSRGTPSHFRLLGSMMSNPEVLYCFIARLPIEALVSLYAISKPFHYLFNQHYVTFIMANARYWAGSEAMESIPWVAFPALTLYDPIRRDIDAENEAMSRWSAGHWKKKYEEQDATAAAMEQRASNIGLADLVDADEKEDEDTVDTSANKTSPQTANRKLPLSRCRILPSLRYLRLLHKRTSQARAICASLAMAGHLNHFWAAWPALMKLSFLTDIQTNANRIGLIHNESYFTGADLYGATNVLIKLDMRLSDGGSLHGFPDASMGAIGWRGVGRVLRQTLLGSGLATLSSVLSPNQRGPTSQLDFWRMLVRCRMRPPQSRLQRILDIPWWAIGQGNKEGRDFRRSQLLRIDELIWKELYRRSMMPCTLFFHAVTAGYLLPNSIDPVMYTRERIIVPRKDGQGELVAYGPLSESQIVAGLKARMEKAR